MTKPAISAARTANKAAAASSAPRKTAYIREAVTLEAAVLHGPTPGVISKIAQVFAMEPVPSAEIREMVEEHLVLQSRAMPLTERNMEMHFQRVVGQYVGSAVSAARFYDAKRATAREMASKLNDDRDEDRDGASGFEGKVERAQMFAAEMAWQAIATLAAAEGAVSAYSHITGSDWKPYVGNTPDNQTLSAQSVTARAAAFD